MVKDGKDSYSYGDQESSNGGSIYVGSGQSLEIKSQEMEAETRVGSRQRDVQGDH